MTKIQKQNRGLLLTGVLMIALFSFILQMIFVVITLFFSTTFELFSSLLGESNTSSIVISLIQFVASIAGFYGCLKLWYLKKIGFYLFVGSLISLFVIGSFMLGNINYYILILYGVWILVTFFNFKKLG